MQWGPEADAKLFMHVLKIHNVKLDFGALAIAMGNDVTPKALTHRIAKLRSIAEDASAPAAGSSSGLPLPQPNKRTRATKRGPRAMTPSPASAAAAAGRKKGGAATNNGKDDDGENGDNTKAVGGTKRTATGAVKNGSGNGNGKAAAGGSPLRKNVSVAAAQGDGDGDEEDGEDEDCGIEMADKKVKTGTGNGDGAAVCGDEDGSAEVGEGGEGSEGA